MSDALRFFREHHAVPATDRGPDWKNGRTEALEGHLYGLMEACNRDETGGDVRPGPERNGDDRPAPGDPDRPVPVLRGRG